jgi:small-conductance mechanosensitive channel
LRAVAIVVELLSGTVYLLLLAAGFAAAAIAAHLGLGTITQLLVAAVVGVGAVLVWYSIQRKRPPAAADRHQPRREPRHRRAAFSSMHGTPTALPPCAIAARNGPSCSARAMRPPPASTAWSR